MGTCLCAISTVSSPTGGKGRPVCMIFCTPLRSTHTCTHTYHTLYTLLHCPHTHLPAPLCLFPHFPLRTHHYPWDSHTCPPPCPYTHTHTPLHSWAYAAGRRCGDTATPHLPPRRGGAITYPILLITVTLPTPCMPVDRWRCELPRVHTFTDIPALRLR